MSEYSQLLEAIKRAALEGVDANRPMAMVYGTVTGTEPLKIRVSQKLELGAHQLILTNAVREYTVEMTVDHLTEDETAHVHAIADTYTGGGSSAPTTHRHAYKGRKRFTAHFGLKAGEKVVLLRVQGGQRYIVLDRLEALA